MKSLTLKQSATSLIIVISIIVIGIIFVIVIPSIKKIDTLQNDISETQKDLEIRFQKKKKLKRSLRELNNIQEAVNIFRGSKIKQGNELAIITQLENLATTQGIKQNLGISASGDNYKFSFLNHGTLDQHMRFFKALEELPYYVLINEINWEKNSGEKSEDPLLTTRFEATIYAN